MLKVKILWDTIRETANTNTALSDTLLTNVSTDTTLMTANIYRNTASNVHNK